MTAEKFWLNWMKISVLCILTAGIVMAIGAPFLSSSMLDRNINAAFFQGEFQGYPVEHLKKWLIGLVGAIMSGWACTLLFIVIYPLRRREKWAWSCIFYSVLLWYILDSAISGYFGVHFNVVLNSIIFLQIMAPLLMLRNPIFLKTATS